MEFHIRTEEDAKDVLGKLSECYGFHDYGLIKSFEIAAKRDFTSSENGYDTKIIFHHKKNDEIRKATFNFENSHSFNLKFYHYEIVTEDFLQGGGINIIKKNGYLRLFINDRDVFSFDSCRIVDEKI